jgi:hypothetical protein
MRGTYLKVSGVDDRTAADRMGHADPATFTRIYTQTIARAQEEAARVGNELVTKTGRFADVLASANP